MLCMDLSSLSGSGSEDSDEGINTDRPCADRATRLIRRPTLRANTEANATGSIGSDQAAEEQEY